MDGISPLVQVGIRKWQKRMLMASALSARKQKLSAKATI
jgi:hypothetical protein